MPLGVGSGFSPLLITVVGNRTWSFEEYYRISLQVSFKIVGASVTEISIDPKFGANGVEVYGLPTEKVGMNG
ncbi:hypothetical protein QL285_026784 [Trifolium repens]|nr:hypothetical protein QL285_026784 [Trifolium repens]